MAGISTKILWGQDFCTQHKALKLRSNRTINTQHVCLTPCPSFLECFQYEFVLSSVSYFVSWRLKCLLVWICPVFWVLQTGMILSCVLNCVPFLTVCPRLWVLQIWICSVSCLLCATLCPTDLEGCQYDYVQLRDGNGRTLLKACGSDLPPTTTTITNR